MTDDQTTAAHAATDATGAAAHDDHGIGHDDGHDDHGAGEALGGIDFRAWGIGVLGVALGLATAVTFAISTGRISF